MLRTFTICLFVACASPHAMTVDAPSAGDDKGDGATSPGRVIRVLDGAATIASDWSASENGETFAPVKDGAPQMPAIVDRALSIAVPTDLSGHKQRFEWKILQASDKDGLHFDNARYAGFKLRLPASPSPFLGSAIVWQAWQGFPYGPPVSLKIATGSSSPYRMRLAIRNSTVGPNSSVPDIELWSGAVLDPGTWHSFLVYVQPRYDGGGALKLWIDGTKVLDWQGAIGYDPAQVAGAYAGLDIKDGIYQPDANNGHTLELDHVVVTTSYAAAAHVLGWQ